LLSVEIEKRALQIPVPFYDLAGMERHDASLLLQRFNEGVNSV
jgi:hypothetical protein